MRRCADCKIRLPRHNIRLVPLPLDKNHFHLFRRFENVLKSREGGSFSFSFRLHLPSVILFIRRADETAERLERERDTQTSFPPIH